MAKLFFDYGHGGRDPGATYKGRKEADDVLKLGKDVAKEMRKHGVQVDESRTTNVTMSLKARTDKANKGNYDFLVSFHRNAFKPEQAQGVECFTYPTGSPKAKSLAKRMQDELVKLGFVNRGTKTANFHMLRESKAPAVLPEVGFVDRTSDNQLFDSKYNQIVQAISKALLDELGIKQTANTPQYFRVRKSWGDTKSQKGAYLNLDGAIAEAKKHKGYKVFDYSGKIVYEDKPTPAPKPTPPSTGNQVAITGKSVATAKQMAAFLKKNNSNPKIKATPEEFCKMFLEEGESEGIRGDIAFCQSIHETGWFNYGGQVLPEQNNFCGLGATNNSPVGKGAWFPTEREGIRAQIQHLKAYANKDSLKNKNIDPRFHLVTRGIAPNWVDLNGRWAVPGPTYGQSILSLFDELLKIVVEEKPVDSSKAEMKKLQQEIEAITKELEKYKGKIEQVKSIVNR